MTENHPDYDPPIPILYLHDWVKYNEGPRCKGYVCIVCREQWTPQNELEPCAEQDRREARGVPRKQGESYGSVEICNIGSLQKRIQAARQQQVKVTEQIQAEDEAAHQQRLQMEKRAEIKTALDKLRNPGVECVMLEW